MVDFRRYPERSLREKSHIAPSKATVDGKLQTLDFPVSKRKKAMIFAESAETSDQQPTASKNTVLGSCTTNLTHSPTNTRSRPIEHEAVRGSPLRTQTRAQPPSPCE